MVISIGVEKRMAEDVFVKFRARYENDRDKMMATLKDLKHEWKLKSLSDVLNEILYQRLPLLNELFKIFVSEGIQAEIPDDLEFIIQKIYHNIMKKEEDSDEDD